MATRRASRKRARRTKKVEHDLSTEQWSALERAFLLRHVEVSGAMTARFPAAG